MQMDYNRGVMVGGEMYGGNWMQPRGRAMHTNNYYPRRSRPYYNRGGGMRPVYPQNYNNYCGQVSRTFNIYFCEIILIFIFHSERNYLLNNI